MKDLVRKAGLSDAFLIESAATSSEEIWGGIGNPVYPPSRAELARHGIPCEKRGARQLIRRDYEDYDLLVCMDVWNVRNTLRITSGDPQGKVHKLLEYAGRADDVDDPWYSGRYDIAYKDIFEGCQALLDAVLEGRA